MDEILPMIIQQGLLTPEQQQDLYNPNHTMVNKQQKLLDIVLWLPESCVDTFLHCLLETSYYEPHKILYDKITE